MNLQKFRTLARNWDAFGDADPFFGILSDPAKYHGQWGVEEFYDSGRAHIDNILGILADRGVSYRSEACLDFGCGVGRLTMPLSTHFERTVGVDVAPSMIDLARRYQRFGRGCEFVVNRRPDLSRFPDRTFDFVHSCLVLQHIPPEITLGYIGEFLRIARPGGLVMFQLPADTYSEEEASLIYALPNQAFAARVDVTDAPASLRPKAPATVRLTVTNESPITWSHDIPAGRFITIANHWLHPDGTVAIPDDGRARLPSTLAPGEHCDVELTIEAPAECGDYQLEIDLVQECVCWFAQYGSRTARVPVRVDGEPAPAVAPPAPPPVKHVGLLRTAARRLLRPLRGGTATFEMHLIPRLEVERTIRAHQGDVLHAIDDNAAGYRWLSYTYVCRRL